ncbi:hypothetical protein [Fischerella sp. PCC 9605]|uniref:hypothetical protein n=1 Tax=Fischerella sp. PCC 9605 TaxID=1173024 RepID=UPI00047C80A4|nr:hypothetical protein [Fischerella sp. PCC 9605]
MRNIAIKFGISSASILMALNVLDYLYEEEKHDYQRSDYPKLRKDFIKYAKEKPFSNEFRETQKSLEKLRIRFYARLISCLSTIRQLEENLEDIFKKFTQYDESKQNKKDCIVQAIKERKEEIKRYYVWRDKVFSHLETNGSKDLKEEIRFLYGGYIIDISKEECLSLKPNPELLIFSELDIITQHEKLLQHYDNWETLFNAYSTS